MLEVEQLWKVYGGLEAVRGLSFRVEPGEILGLVGPNGAGKTTTMRCLCGIITPSAGEISICGIPMFAYPVEAKRNLAFVPAEPRFFPYLTVWEHLQMFARLYGSGDQKAHAEALLDALVLQEKRNHLPAALSRGMQQKLMMACALIHNPKVMIFDEPFTGLDPLAIRKARQLLRERAKEGAAILISSHLLAMVEGMVDRVLIIQAGNKIAHGDLKTLKASMPTLQANAGLEDIFLHATGAEASGAAPQQAIAHAESAKPAEPAESIGVTALIETSEEPVAKEAALSEALLDPLPAPMEPAPAPMEESPVPIDSIPDPVPHISASSEPIATSPEDEPQDMVPIASDIAIQAQESAQSSDAAEVKEEKPLAQLVLEGLSLESAPEEGSRKRGWFEEKDEPESAADEAAGDPKP